MPSERETIIRARFQSDRVRPSVNRPHRRMRARIGKNAQKGNQQKLPWGCVYFFFSLWVCSFRTFLTIFCSSIRKALTMRSRTQLPHLEPPYARWTVFFGLEIWAYSRGRRAGTCVVTNRCQHVR